MNRQTRQWLAEEDAYQAQSRIQTPPLPGHIKPEAGKITAYADWDNGMVKARSPRGVTIPIYLINRTNDYYSVSVKDWHSYFMLEVNIDGKWQRAQSYPSGGCGLGHGSRILRPGQHMVLDGIFPGRGTHKAPARFRRLVGVDTAIVTNPGEARYDPAQIELSRYDLVAIHYEMPADDLLNIIDAKATWPAGGKSPSVKIATGGAINALGRRFPDRGLKLYRKWSEQSDSQSQERLYDLMEGLLYSKTLSRATVLDWANGKMPLEDAPKIQSIRAAALGRVGHRYPDLARQLIQKLAAGDSPDLDTLADLLTEFTGRLDVSKSDLLFAVDIQFRFDSLRHGWFAVDDPLEILIHRYPQLAVQKAGEYRERYGSKVDYAVLKIEEKAFVSPKISTDWLIDVALGKIELQQIESGAARSEAMHVLYRKDSGKAEQLVAGLEGSKNQNQQKLAKELRQHLKMIQKTQEDETKRAQHKQRKTDQ